MIDLDLGLRRLRSLIAEADEETFSDFGVLEYRLDDILQEERKFGRSPETERLRVRVIAELNTFVHRVSGYSFNDLCRPEFVQFREKRAIHNLPHPDYGEFIGREHEVELLLKVLRPYPHSPWQVIIIHGIGGSGKTTLAQELAWRLVHSYSLLPPEERFEAIVWLTAKENVLTQAGIRQHNHHFHSIQDIFRVIAQTLEHPEIMDAAPAQHETLIRQVLQQQRTLVILDNLETVAIDQIVTFLNESLYTTKVLITSRHKVTNLPGRAIELKGMTSDECYRLIDRECRRELNNEVELSEEQTADLFKLTGGIPLAIVWSIGLARNGRGIDQVIQRLEQADNDLARYCFDYSMEAVREDKNAYRLLMALSFCPGEVSQVTLGLMAGLIQDRDALGEALSMLVQMSLIVHRADSYTMLPLARSYARAELWKHPDFHQAIRDNWRPDQDSELRHIEDIWKRAIGAHAKADTEVLWSNCYELARRFSKPLEIALIGEPVSPVGEIPGFVADCAETYNIPRFMRLHMLFISGIRQLDRLAEETEYWRRQSVASTTLVLLIPLFYKQQLEEVDPVIRRLRLTSGVDLAIFTRDDILTAIASLNPARELRRVLLRQLDVRRLAPFVTHGPVSEGMFFGRERELRTIMELIEQRSCAVIGGSMIGKTSLLLRLRSALPPMGLRVVYQDCSGIRTADEFMALRLDQPNLPQESGTSLGDLLQQVQPDWRLVLLLDEVDKLIASDRADAWRLWLLLRDLSSGGRCQIVFAGERMLRDMLSDASSPWFNSAEEIVLGGLEQRSAAELVERTMGLLEIDLVGEVAVAGQLYDMTGGHPRLLQEICLRLLKHSPVNAERWITADEVAVVMAELPQREALVETYWGAATPFERIITLVMAVDTACRTAAALQQAIARLGLMDSTVEITNALDRLVDLRFMLRRDTERYEFAFPFLKQTIESLPGLHDRIHAARDQYIASRPTPYSIEDALPHDSPVYITRPADREILLYLRRMEYIVLRGPQKVGKTSLVNRLSHELSGKAYRIAYLNCTTLDTSDEMAWYRSLFQHLSAAIGPDISAELTIHDGAGFDELLEELQGRLEPRRLSLVIVLDEVEAVPAAWSDRFFAIVRKSHSSRHASPGLEPITFLLVIASDPRDLIQDPAISPFNIAHSIWLDDLSLKQVTELASFLPISQSRLPSIAERIFSWTSGHPYLAQRLCLYLSAETDITPDTIDAQVRRMLHDGVSHLQGIVTALNDQPDLLRYYQRVATGQVVSAGRLILALARLEMLGVIKDEGGSWVIRNRIYEMALSSLLENLSRQDEIVQHMTKTLNEEALRALCLFYRIDYQTLPGQEKHERIVALVRLLDQRGQLPALLLGMPAA